VLEKIAIDVSELLPPEPMTQILVTLKGLMPTQYLQVLHRRQPFPLYEALLNNGWKYHCIDCSNTSEQPLFHIYIVRPEHFDELMLQLTKSVNVN